MSLGRVVATAQTCAGRAEAVGPVVARQREASPAAASSKRIAIAMITLGVPVGTLPDFSSGDLGGAGSVFVWADGAAARCVYVIIGWLQRTFHAGRHCEGHVQNNWLSRL